ncbi:unnamed protein product [Angiostrongylus costaricensis]|uniref:Peptidase_M13 domain-containing protein n=1 Tax=Angiostrongylus costaricensis TaxID=334426 RepID=A0A158PIL3_ANGCS|nr:unnamed protein product [Angiostrongylus costaricensis]
MGGWELLTKAQFDPAHYRWEITAGQLAAVGAEGLIKVFVHSSFEDRNTQTLMIRWQLFFNEELRSSLGVLDDDVTVNVMDVGYFDGLSALVKSKPLSSINNYLMWRLVSTFDMYLPMQYRRPAQKFYASVFGTTAEAEEMIADLKRSMERVLLDADWMDDTVKKVALRKLKNMRYKTGFPNMMRDEIAVLKLYEGVKMEADHYFDNALQLKKLAIRHGLNRLHNPPSKDEWVSPVIAVDAYHYFTGNEIIFPAAILQFPMFVPEAPVYVNYAAIGFGIGHEITHGYDDLGSQYDEIGNLRAWWDRRTLAMFQKKRECFITQYSNQAYKMRCLLEEDTLALPGLSFYSPEQLFFIAFANIWCEKVKPSALNYTMETEVHPLGMFRVNVPLQNFPPFSEAFQCPVGSAMNPHKKCRIWIEKFFTIISDVSRDIGYALEERAMPLDLGAEIFKLLALISSLSLKFLTENEGLRKMK